MSLNYEALSVACEKVWNLIRSGSEVHSEAFHREFRVEGFPGPQTGGVYPQGGDDPASTPTDAGDEYSLDTVAIAGLSYLQRFFGEGKGLTNLVHEPAGAQILNDVGVAHMRWIAEYGLGEGGSPRFVSGRVSLTFRGDPECGWQLHGWLGSRGPHAAEEGVNRGEDVKAIREQILRVFEAYRQKDLTMLRRTHTADWRGFTLKSGTVDRGIDAYMRAAQGALSSMEWEEYQIFDLDAVFYGDLAIVPYIARIGGRNRQGTQEAYRLRVLDVYLREPLGWNQVSTNVSLHPEEIMGGA